MWKNNFNYKHNNTPLFQNMYYPYSIWSQRSSQLEEWFPQSVKWHGYIWRRKLVPNKYYAFTTADSSTPVYNRAHNSYDSFDLQEAAVYYTIQLKPSWNSCPGKYVCFFHCSKITNPYIPRCYGLPTFQVLVTQGKK